MKTMEYVDAVRAITATGSVYAAAKLLEMSEDTVRNYALGRSYPDPYACARIAEVLDLPLEQVIADVNAEKESDPGRRAYWVELARKFAACVVMGSAIAIGATDDASATGRNAKKAESGSYLATNYASLARLVLWLLGLRRAFARFPALRAPTGPGCPAHA